ncbi:MAG: hypothetical protein IKL40_03050 [Clostridia bacterium]|nr:hypothetical protein [Clostridia bacterium]
MNRKSGSEIGYRPSFEGKTHRNNNIRAENDGGKSMQSVTTTVPEDIKNAETNIPRKKLPEPPPNYRGMIYDSFPVNDIEAEGLDRLVRNDVSYSDHEKKRREEEYKKNKAVNAMGRNALLGETDCDTGGLERLVEGIRSKRFSSEDILLCAMILLMLNSGSDDDILMVLVLMMLL